MDTTWTDESGQAWMLDASGQAVRVRKTPPAAGYIDVGDDPFAPATFDYTPRDIQQLEKQGAERAALVGGAAALGDVARFAATALPTAADAENEKRLAELAKHKGLTEGERADIDEQAMRGVRAMWREVSARMGDQLASSGQASAASLQRARASSQDALNRAAIQAADIGIRENRAQVIRDREEEQRRIAEKASRDNEKREVAVSTLASFMQAAAPAVAAAAVKSKPTETQFLKLQAMTNADGSPKYAALKGMTYDDFLALTNKKMQEALASRPDGAVMLPQ